MDYLVSVEFLQSLAYVHQHLHYFFFREILAFFYQLGQSLRTVLHHNVDYIILNPRGVVPQEELVTMQEIEVSQGLSFFNALGQVVFDHLHCVNHVIESVFALKHFPEIALAQELELFEVPLKLVLSDDLPAKESVVEGHVVAVELFAEIQLSALVVSNHILVQHLQI